ncbi:MAG: DUF3089 domain-containing protein [Pseudomonadota bacterium]
MKKVFLTLLTVLLALPATLWAALAIWGEDLLEYHLRPALPFEQTVAPAAPDYHQDRFWAALPGKASPARLLPSGESAPALAPADVFYIHPTSLLNGEQWNAPLFTDTRNWEMINAMLASQASAFNACCDVYAPHYRQATLWSFIDDEGQGGERALALAYRDVEAAFDVFLAERSVNRPFIIASHSQGTYHALRLLAERIEGQEIADRLVAAYLVGYWVPMDTFERNLPSIPPCTSAAQTGCVVHWSTYGEGGEGRSIIPHWYPEGQEVVADKDILCTNPLTWQVDERYADASQHPGALYLSAGGSVLNTLFDTPAGVTFDALPDVLEQWTWAQCRDGLLFIEPQEDTLFAKGSDPETRDYHMMDYNLFYQAVRNNAALRVEAFVALNTATANLLLASRTVRFL